MNSPLGPRLHGRRPPRNGGLKRQDRFGLAADSVVGRDLLLLCGLQTPRPLGGCRLAIVPACLVLVHARTAVAKPLITCTDSGGPLEFVEPGATGLVTGPSAGALAEALVAFALTSARLGGRRCADGRSRPAVAWPPTTPRGDGGRKRQDWFGLGGRQWRGAAIRGNRPHIGSPHVAGRRRGRAKRPPFCPCELGVRSF
jgi:hypothetical protein